MSLTQVIKRKYAFQRIAPGLVLLPGNDGKTFYVIGRYADGPTWGLQDEPRDFRAWGWGRINPGVMERVRALTTNDPERAVDLLREHVFDNTWPRHQTMRAAIEDALTSTGNQQ